MPIASDEGPMADVNDKERLRLKTALAFGALLHDIGKVVYRGDSGKGTHSKLGSDFIKDEVAPSNSGYDDETGFRIIEQIRYHHAKEMTSASLSSDSLAYITYFADNISAGMDRKNEGDEGQTMFFDRDAKLRKVFNIINGHHDDNVIEHDDYNAIREGLRKNLIKTEVSWKHVNSMINVLEAWLHAVPSSTNVSQIIDVSLFDHAKTTAGVATCIYEYLDERGIANYQEALFDKSSSGEYYDAPMFLLCSCDMSGIQDFIYNISGSKALKQLRARSMYLEMLLEHIVDELIDRAGLTRANLLYTGGGHAYMLLPNTVKAKHAFDSVNAELKSWFLEHYRNDLYIASACIPCSSNDLANKGDDRHCYQKMFQSLSARLSEVKASRYDAKELYSLNFGDTEGIDRSRECTECHRSDLSLNSEGKCALCAELEHISKDLVRKNVFVVTSEDEGLALPFGKTLHMYSREEYLAKKPGATRLYTKNSWDVGVGLATHIWMGDYTANDKGEIAEYASSGITLPPVESAHHSLGIERLGVLRADVDNLGITFSHGLPEEKASISRTATLSRSMSYFFKCKINEVLSNGGYQAQIIYSGGDDLFIIGNWCDIIYAAIDIRQALDAFTGNGSLTISAGIGMFDKKFPIARMAAETGSLEDAAKMYRSPVDRNKTKDAVALWSGDQVFGWEEFIGSVAPRFQEIHDMFDRNEKGKAFIYKLVGLLRNSDDAISAPRLAYLLARSFADVPEGTESSKKLYDWAQDRRERKYLVTALEWYVYSIRERG